MKVPSRSGSDNGSSIRGAASLRGLLNVGTCCSIPDRVIRQATLSRDRAGNAMQSCGRYIYLQLFQRRETLEQSSRQRDEVVAIQIPILRLRRRDKRSIESIKYTTHKPSWCTRNNINVAARAATPNRRSQRSMIPMPISRHIILRPRHFGDTFLESKLFIDIYWNRSNPRPHDEAFQSSQVRAG